MWAWFLKWILPVLVDIAIKFGMPAVLEWIIKKFPFIPKQVIEQIFAIIAKALDDIDGNPDPVEARRIRAEAKRMARQCVGVACKPTTKGLD